MDLRWLPCIALCACGGKDGDDTGGPDVDALCAGQGAPRLVIGTGAGSSFVPFEAGDHAKLVVAPQGGFGVDIRVSTTGLKTEENVPVLMEPWLDGAAAGSFTANSRLFCQDDGSGMAFGIVVGFDPGTYPSNDDLLALDQSPIELRVAITDSRGIEATGTAAVILDVGAR